MRALLVDDSKAIRTVIRRMLQQAGYEDIAEATNGLEGLEILASGPPPDLVLVDWNMPEMSGIEFVRAVRERGLVDRASVIMVTSESTADKVVEALEAGANEYLMKPFTRDALIEKIDLARAGH